MLLLSDRPGFVLSPAGNLAMGVRLDPGAASKRDQAGDPHTDGSNIGSELADGFSTETTRLPPVTLLAPLQLLQSHRRGAITSPKLHAAPNSPLSRPPGPISGDLHTSPLVPTFPHHLSGGSTTMVTSTIATSSNSVVGNKSRSKRGLKQTEDVGECLGCLIGILRGSTQSDFEVELGQCLHRQSTRTILTNRQSPSLARNENSPTPNHPTILTLSS